MWQKLALPPMSTELRKTKGLSAEDRRKRIAATFR